jgi:hypothetical protein
MTHRRRQLIVVTTIAAVIVCVAAVFIVDAIAGGVKNHLLAAVCAVVIGLIIGPLAGLWISAALDDGDIDQVVERRAPSRR